MSEASRRRSRFIGALLAYSLIVPIVAAFITVLAYTPLELQKYSILWVPPNPTNPLLVGLAITLIAWWLVAWWSNGFAAAAGMHATIYNELQARHERLRARLNAVPEVGGPVASATGAGQPGGAPPGQGGQATSVPSSPEIHTTAAEMGGQALMPRLEQTKASLAYRTAATHQQFVARRLNSASIESQGTAWVLGAGYTDAWNHIHRAEEELVAIEEPQEVIAGAFHDYLRIKGSRIDEPETLQRDLQLAVASINGKEAIKLFPEPRFSVEAELLEPRKARAVLALVRGVINRYRDSQWQGVLRLRNRLIYTATLTGVVAYALLALAICVQAPPHTIQAAASFFLIGALAGLLGRLRTAAETETVVEDYGLDKTRLLITPVFSGLGAIGGVLLITVLPGLVNLDVVTNQAVPTPTPTLVATSTLTPVATFTATLPPIAQQVPPTRPNEETVPAPTATPSPAVTPGAPAAGSSQDGRLTSTSTQTPTLTPTSTSSPTSTATATPTPTPTVASTLTPTPATMAGPTMMTPGRPLTEIFSINSIALFLAAVFGLTPGLLVARLAQAERYLGNILSSEAPSTSAGRGASGRS